MGWVTAWGCMDGVLDVLAQALQWQGSLVYEYGMESSMSLRSTVTVAGRIRPAGIGSRNHVFSSFVVSFSC